jgi:fucose 4-O-acetylase-like acetyltransferase
MATASLGIILFSALVASISLPSGITILSLLGRNSMPIYALHYYFVKDSWFYTYVTNEEIMIILKTIIAICLSIIIAKAMGRVAILRTLFLADKVFIRQSSAVSNLKQACQ